jgi:hypothetical protein
MSASVLHTDAYSSTSPADGETASAHVHHVEILGLAMKAAEPTHQVTTCCSKQAPQLTEGISTVCSLHSTE